jgi:hypothetical protein
MKVRLRLVRGALAALAVLAVGVGVGYAAAPVAGDVIHGCVGPTGLLEVIGADAECKQNQTPISWNQTGPPGADGQDGAPGEAVAYARITAAGDVAPQFSSNVVQANVTHPAPGLYCIGGLSFSPRSVVATGRSGIDASGNPTFVDTIVTVTVSDPGVTFPLGCAVTDRVRVRTIAATQGTALVDRGFDIWFED